MSKYAADAPPKARDNLAWDDPVDPTAEAPRRVFPVQAFPTLAADYISALATHFQVDPSMPGAAVLAAMSDGALVIARHGSTKRDQLARAVGNLQSVGAHVLGTVITMTPSRGRNAYEYSYYYESDKSLPQLTAVPALNAHRSEVG